MIHFGDWDDNIHSLADQEDRIYRATLAKTSPDFVNIHNETATFEGSGANLYTASLNKCSCGDFIHRRLPCKHIYRLAMELGLIQFEFQSGRNKNNILKYIPMLSYEAKKLLLTVMNKDGYYSTRSKSAEELVINGFCCENLSERKKTGVVVLETLPEIEDNRFAVMKALRHELEEEQCAN